MSTQSHDARYGSPQSGGFSSDMNADAGQNGGQGQLIDVWQLLRVLRRWWWMILAFILILTGGAAAILYNMVPIYSAAALLEVKQEERNIVDVSEVENVVVDKEFLTTQIELLKSESLAQSVVESLNLTSDPYFFDSSDEANQALTRDERLRVTVSAVRSNLNVVPVGRSRLIRTSFQHSDPGRAALIANTVTETFINDGLSRKFNSTAYARDFLEGRLATVRASLEAAERELVAYASDNEIIIVNGEDAQDATGSLDITSLKTLNEELTQASLDRVAAEAAYAQSLQSGFNEELLTNETLARLQSERMALNSEYLEKRAIFKDQHPDMVELRSRIDLFDQEVATLSDSIIAARQELSKEAFERARKRENDLRRRVNTLKNSVIDVRERSIDYNILRRQVETERTQYEGLLQRLKEVSVADDLGSDLVQIVDRAQIPRSPFKPNRIRGILLALLLSSLLGFGIAFILETIDDHVRSPGDITAKLKQIIMGVIPMNTSDDDLMDVLANPQSSVSEAYASLRTNLQFSGPDGGPKIIQLTSTRSGEGKSVSSLAVALRFANDDQRVLLIDGDMRLPTFTVRPGQESIGLSGVLTTDVDFGDEIKPTKYNGLDLLPSGISVPNPSEILSSSRFDELLDYARQHYRYIIIDSPPVLGLADAPVLGAKVDATLLIVEAGRLRTPNIRASIERLQNSGTRLIGVVLTKYKATTKGYMDYYNYTYGDKAGQYGATETSRKSKKPRESKRKFEIV